MSQFPRSPCSASEYHRNSGSEEWRCLSNFPRNTNSNETIFIGNTIEYTYSLDDQCRMEFGEGFAFCSTFEVTNDKRDTDTGRNGKSINVVMSCS